MLTQRILSPLKNHVRRHTKKLFWLLPPLFIIALFMLANWCFPLPKTRLHPPPSPIVLDRNGQWLRAFLADDGMWRIAVSHQQSAVSEQENRSSKRHLLTKTEN